MNVQQQYCLFLDLDGVLVDFNKGVKKIFGKEAGDMKPRQLWAGLARCVDFYANLEWMPDGRQLWEFARHYKPIILTGIPIGTWAEPQKRAWCARELGVNTEVIVCMSRQKAEKAVERSTDKIPILVDDRVKLAESWKAMNGIFIHHRNGTDSIAALSKLGF